MGSTACEPTGSKTMRGRLHFMILRPHPEQSGRQVKFSKYVNEGVLIVCCLLSDPMPWNLWLSPASTYMTTWSILSLQLLSQYGAANVQLSRHHKRMKSSKSNQKTKVSMAFRSQSLPCQSADAWHRLLSDWRARPQHSRRSHPAIQRSNFSPIR